MAETALITTLAITAAGASAAAYQANQNNRAVRRSAKSATAATGRQIAQIRSAAKEAKQQNVRREQQVVGRLRVASADAGVGFGGAYDALALQAAFDTAYSNRILDINTQDNVNRVESGLEATLASIESQMASPFLAALTGGGQGMQTGLAISSTMQQPNQPQPPQVQNPQLEAFNIGGSGGRPSYGGSGYA